MGQSHIFTNGKDENAMRSCGSGKLFRGLLAVTLAALAHPGWAQLRAGAVYTSSDAASETGFPRLRLVLAPTDPHTTLQAADLTLVEDGHDQKRAVEIRSFESTGYPLAAAVVIDVSGSMAGKPIDTIRRSLVQFVKDARPKDKVAVMTLADDARWDAPFGADRDKVRQQIASIAPRGHLTRLYDGLVQALGDFPAAPQRRELTVISDGHDEGSHATLDQVLEMARTRGIAIDAIGMTRSNAQYLQTLETLAEQTGGSFREAESNEELEALVGNAIANLKSTPVASFDLERISPDGKRHQLAVRAKKSGTLSNTVSFVAPTKAAHPLEYFVRRLPQGVWLAAGGVLLLVIVGIVLAVRAQQQKKRQLAALYAQQALVAAAPSVEPAIAPQPEPALNAEPQHLPTFDWKAPASAQPGPASAPQPAPKAPAQPAAPRKTVMGGIFLGVGDSLGRLLAESGPLAGQSFAISRQAVLEGRFWMGANPGCAVSLAQDDTVSGYHAYLIYDEPILILADNQSTNGTQLNGELVRNERRPLKPNDRIQIGRTLFRIVA